MRIFFYTLSLFVLTSCSKTENKTRDLELNYDKEAKVWEETLPLGNGRLGMMPNGGVEKETIVLNDISMWSGNKEAPLNKDARNYLPKIQKLLLNGKNLEAQEIMYKHFKCKGNGSNFGRGKDAPYGCFQLLGNLDIIYNYADSTETENYKRQLNISNAVANTQFSKNGVNYKREYFASHENDVLIVRITADKKASISLSAQLSRPERANFFTENGSLYMQGQLNDGQNGNNGVQFKTRLHPITKGGKLTTKNNTLHIKNADEVLLLISSATDYFYADYKQKVDSLLKLAQTQPFENLKAKHIAKYKEKFDRVVLELEGTSDSIAQLTIPQRLEHFQKGKDPELVALYFQFGRYLMISGTRENSMPLNLQGLWANTAQTPWNGDYHLNINVQMNYWQAEVCNLSELHRPLLDFTKSLVPSGEQTAKSYYNAKGWVAHVISNPWHFTAPGEHASWGATNTSGAWLCSHLWEHFAFTQDTTYLKSVFQTMKKAGEFFLSTMIEEPKQKWLVTAPSSSPENSFYMEDKNKPVYVCMGPTMDAQIIRQLFQNTIKAASILGESSPTIDKMKASLPLLPPTQISDEGYIQEWLEDYTEVDVHHRHVSHLYGLYPAAQISPSQTPKLAKAAKVTLNRRGDEGTGWSRAWKINFWARLYEGNRAYKLLKNLLHPSFGASYDYHHKSGTYPNLFCAHPPFQIDGNFGGTAGIAEMLIQSHEGYINILPAIPDHWKNGQFQGLRVRGGAIVDAKWTDGKLSEIILKATANNTFKVQLPTYTKSYSASHKYAEIKTNLISIAMQTDEVVSIKIEG